MYLNSVNQLFGASEHFTRVQLSERDVLAPFAALFLCNLIVLVCWTVLDPLTYERQLYAGTDFWNREIASYGACRSDNVTPYIVPLALVNLLSLAIACWQAYKARSIQSEFSEAKFIGLTVSSMFQAFLTGIPIVVVVRDMPEAYYLVMTFMIFVLCMAVLLLIFLPKYFSHRAYTKLSPSDQRKVLMARSVRSKSIAMEGKSVSKSMTMDHSGHMPPPNVLMKTSHSTKKPHMEHPAGTIEEQHPEGRRVSDVKSNQGLSSSLRKSDDVGGGNYATNTNLISDNNAPAFGGAVDDKTVSEITADHIPTPSVQFRVPEVSDEEYGGDSHTHITNTASQSRTTIDSSLRTKDTEATLLPPTGKTIRERMEDLETIKEFLSEEEYSRKKQELLDSI